MRRALLVAVLAAPAMALAQVSAPPGRLVEIDNFNADVPTSYVNAAQCAGAPLRVEWNLGGSPTFVTDDTFQVYATDTTPSVQGDANIVQCATEPSPNATPPVAAKLVDSVTPATRTVERLDLSATEVVVDAAGFTCDEESETKVVHVCAHWADASSNVKGAALGQFVIQVRPPNRPSSVSTTPGENALNISWPAAPPEGAVAARSYRVVVLRDGMEVRRIDDTTALEARVEDLENDVTYEVRVFGLSVAKNPSATFASTTGTPKPVEDFWESYQGAGGREEGGCGTGAAGPLALLAVAGLLAARRRM